MSPKGKMAREMEELRQELERERREKRELEASKEREVKQLRRERLQLIARIEALEKDRHEARGGAIHEKDLGENNNEEGNHDARQEQEDHEVADDPNDTRFLKLIKVVQITGLKTRVDLPIYHGKMESEEVLGWIEALEKYFDLEDIEEDKKVKVSKEKLRVIALNWWTSLQNERMARGLDKI